MGYSTQKINPVSALNKIKSQKVEVYSASDIELFERWPRITEIVSVDESDHGHIIFNIKKLRFVDYKLI